MMIAAYIEGHGRDHKDKRVVEYRANKALTKVYPQVFMKSDWAYGVHESREIFRAMKRTDKIWKIKAREKAAKEKAAKEKARRAKRKAA